jgi:hypothetical protein
MATADDYAGWIVKNADKKGTPEFDTVAAAYKEALAEEQPAPKAEAKPAAPAAKPAPALKAAPSESRIRGADEFSIAGRELPSDIRSAELAPRPTTSDLSVMKDEFKGTPDKTGFLPVRPEVRQALKNKYNSASPEERAYMEMTMPGAAGEILREHAQKVQGRQTKRTEELKRQVRTGQATPGALDQMELGDTSVESRTTRLVGEGEKPEFASRAAELGALQGVTPGKEIAAIQSEGTLEPTDFDFEMQKQYKDANVLIRGAVAGYQGYKQGALGVNQAIAELVGADEFARTQGLGAKEARVALQSMGENPNYVGRMFEGAISSIAQQLPAMLAGAVTGSEGVVLGSMFVQAFGQEYSEGRAKGLNGADAANRAGLMASFEVLGEKFGLKFTMDNIRRATSGMKTDALKDFLGNTLKKELPGEYLTTTGQFLTDKSSIGLDKNATFGDYLQRMADTTVQTVMQSGLMTGGTKAVGKATEFLGGGRESGAEQLDRLTNTTEEAQAPSPVRRPTLGRLEAANKTELQGGEPGAPPLSKLESARDESLEVGAAPSTTPAAPVVDPNMEALVKSYVDQGYMDDDARRLAEASLSAVYAPADNRQGRVLERDDAEAETQRVQGLADRAAAQAAGETINVGEPPLNVTEALPDETGEGTPSAYKLGLNRANDAVAAVVAREEQERTALNANKQRVATKLSEAFRLQAYPNLSPIFGAEWMQRTMASNPTPDEFQEAAYAKLEELSPTEQAAPKVETVKAETPEPGIVRKLALEEQKQAGWNPNWPFVPVDLSNADFRQLIVDDPNLTQEEKNQIFEAGKKLNIVPKNETATKETPSVTKTTEAKQTKKEGQAQPAAKPAASSSKPRPTLGRLEAANKTELQTDESAASAVEEDRTEALELLATRNEELEREEEDRALLSIDEHMKKVYGTTATGELRKRAPGAGPKESGTAKTKEQENKESKEYNQYNRDVINVLISAADRYTPIPEHLQDGSDEQRIKGRTGMYPTEAEYDYAEAVRIKRLEKFQTALYRLAQVRSSQKAYVAAKDYINGLPKVQRERAKALWEGTAKPIVLPPKPKATLTPAQLIRFRKGEDISKKRGRPKKEKPVVEADVWKTEAEVKAADETTLTPEEFEAELKGPSYADDTGSSAPNLSLNAMVKTMVEQGTLSEREAEAINEEIERSKNDEDNFLDDIEDGDLDYEDARNMSLPELTALTKLAAEIAGSEHTHDEDPVFLQLKTLPAALGYIAQTGTPLDAGIAEALLTGENRRLVDATKLIVVKASTAHPAGSVAEFWQDAMDGSTGMTVPSPDRTKATVLLAHPDYGHQGINNRTVLHEGIHAVTIAKLFYVEQMIGLGRQDEVDPKLLDAYDELQDLMQRTGDAYVALVDSGKATDELMHLASVNAFDDMHEFVAYGLTEPAMKALLFTVPGTATKTSGFSNFVNALMKLLGVNPKFKSGMKDFVLGTSRLMTIKTPAAAKMAEAREQANQKADNAIKAMRLTEKEIKAEHDKLQHSKDSRQKLSILGNMAKLSRDPTELGRLLVAKWNRMSLKDMRETGFLKLLPTDELIKRGTELGIGSLNDITNTIEKMVTFRVKLLKQVDRIGTQWLKLKEQDAENLADVMHFTTLVAIDPTKDKSNTLVNAEWKKLTDDAKAVYVAVRDWYANNYKLYGQYLKERVDAIAGDADESKTLMAAIRTVLEAGAKLAPYFPLMRYGKYWARIGGSGKKAVFAMFEDKDSRDAFVREHMAEVAAKGDKRSRERMFEDGYLDEGNSLAELVNKLPEHNDTIRDLFATIDNMKSVDADAKNTLKQEVFQMHLNTMPDESFRKQFLHRKGTAGFTNDALRNFGNLTGKMINQLGRIKYGPALRNHVSAARASLKGNPDKAKLGMIIDRVEARVDAEIAPTLEDDWLAPAMQVVTKAAFLWQMTSVKSAVTQLFSLTTHGLPVLWKHHGVGRSTMQAVMDTASMGFGLVGKIKTADDGSLKYEFPSLRNSLAGSPVLQKAYDAFIDSQQNQQTRTADLVGRSKVPSSQYGALAKTIENGMTYFFHTAESMSREIMFIASFKLNYNKLNKDKNLTDQQKFDTAVRNAKGETKEALFNYEQFNTPEAMRPVPLQAVLQYRKFQVFSLTYLLRNGTEMLSSLPASQRAGAAKAFFGTLGLSGLLAGVRYAFMYGVIMAAIQGAINLLHDDDEEMPPELLNFKKYFENVWLPQKLGGLGNFAAHGLLDSVTGYDMGSGMSQDFWFRDAPEAPNWKSAYLNMAAGLAGPAGGMVSNWMSAIDDFNNGDHLKAFEKLTPAMFRGIVTDIRYEKEGVRGMGLDPVKDSTKFTQFQYFMQALGYKTAPLAQKLSDNFAIKEIVRKVEGQRSSLLRSLLHADELGTQKDFNKVLDRVDRFNAMYPDREIEDENIDAAFDRRDKMLEDTERGLYVPEGYESLYKLGRQSDKALRKEEQRDK